MLTCDRIAGAFLALFALGVIIESRALPLGTLWEPGPAYMPVFLALALFLLAALIMIFGGAGKPLGELSWKEWPHAVAILCASLFAALALERLGYRLTILLTCLFLLKAVERKSWTLTAIFALAMAFGSFFLFYTILRVPLPRGPMGF
ncbi:MAG: tripartite tricarboxylate transporter TctB family protein [Deltaproteobacteria bacterium]|nr:tripartite tricarboxylate transporter TctB family protein [Deltaproteobacteria bacterium]